jgi:hypothetical protein
LGQVWVGNRLMHCNMGTSAIWEMIFITWVSRHPDQRGECLKPARSGHLENNNNPVRANRDGVEIRAFGILLCRDLIAMPPIADTGKAEAHQSEGAWLRDRNAAQHGAKSSGPGQR